jgi:universal stress protein A
MPREFKTILCPTDFSEESYRAVDYGLRFAQVSGGTLLLAHIIHIPSEHLFRQQGHMLTFEEVKAQTRSLLEEVRDQRLGSHPQCEIVIEIGDPYEQLMAIARQRHVDLIVISTHGRTGLEHLVMGSVAEKIIRHAPCPVFVVRRGLE